MYKISVLGKKFYPLEIKFIVENETINEPVLFIWEDDVTKNIKFIDKIDLSSGIEYFSTINKNIDFFVNAINFKIVLLKNYECIFTYKFRNLSFLNGKYVLYISQNSYTGYSHAARNYIYQLLNSDFIVSWDTRFTMKNFYNQSNQYEKTVFDCLNRNFKKYDSIIIHHTPEAWEPLYKQFKTENNKIYGLTTWETTKLHTDWVNYINKGADEVIVPSKFNIETFKNSGVYKKVNLWYHEIFPFSNIEINESELFEKFLLYKNGLFINEKNSIESIIKNNTVYYNISQFSNRKNIEQVIDVFYKRFSEQDNVCLFIKTHLENFSKKEKLALQYKFHNIIKKFNKNLNIIFCFEDLNTEQINYIHKFSDVYFTLNRGEGFGLCTYMAKQIGNKIICGKFGAEREFLDDGDVLLDYELGSSDNLDDFNKHYVGNGQKCAFYDTNYVISKVPFFEKVNKTL